MEWVCTTETLPAPIQIAGSCCGPLSGSGYNHGDMTDLLREQLHLKTSYTDPFHFLAIVTDDDGRIVFAAGSEYSNCGLWVKATFEIFYQDGLYNPDYTPCELHFYD